MSDPAADPCETCPIGASTAVASRGPIPARLLFLSGAPRYHEEREQMAFASPLYPWLHDFLGQVGLDPSTVHYATLVGCRPPHQRPLHHDELLACAPRLERTISAITPDVIVLCGPEPLSAIFPELAPSTVYGTLIARDSRRYYPIRHPYSVSHSERYVAELTAHLHRLSDLLARAAPADYIVDAPPRADIPSPHEPRTEPLHEAEPAPIAQTMHQEDDEADGMDDATQLLLF